MNGYDRGLIESSSQHDQAWEGDISCGVEVKMNCCIHGLPLRWFERGKTHSICMANSILSITFGEREYLEKYTKIRIRFHPPKSALLQIYSITNLRYHELWYMLKFQRLTMFEHQIQTRTQCLPTLPGNLSEEIQYST